MFLGNLRSLVKLLLSSQCFLHYLQSPKERSPRRSQLTAVKYPCSVGGQIPLRPRRSITRPPPPPWSSAKLHKHVLCNVEFAQILPVSCELRRQPLRLVAIEHRQSVYRSISRSVTCFCLKSSFSNIPCQMLLSVPFFAKAFAASRRSLPHVLHLKPPRPCEL